MRATLVLGATFSTFVGLGFGYQDEPSRAEVQQFPSLCTASVEAALLAVLQAEAELDGLSRPLQHDGEVIETQVQYDLRVRSEGSDFTRFLEAHCERFDLHGKLPPYGLYIADLIRFDAGFQAAQGLVVQEAFQHADVLALFTPSFFQTPPILGTDEAVQYHRAQKDYGALAPLTNGSALAYLTFGLLYQDNYWAQEANDREAFLADLLARGFESRLVAAGVSRALEAPLSLPRSGTGKSGRGIAGPMKSLRAKVGFTEVHEDVLVSDLATVNALEALGLDRGELDLRDRAVESAVGLPPKVVPNPKGHLKRWLPMMLTLVREEIYPGGAPEMMRHGETMEERLSYWHGLFSRHGFLAGRERALQEIESILAGTDLHPLSLEIDQLLAREAAGGLTPEEQWALGKLRQEREADRHKLISSMVDLMAQTGATSHYEILLETLTADLPLLLLGKTDQLQAKLLGNGWMILSISGQPQIGQTLLDYLSGDGGLPDYAPDKVIMGYAAVSGDAGQVALTAIVEEGSTRDICHAIQNGEWMPRELFTAITDNLFLEFDKQKTTDSERAQIAHCTMTALVTQKDDGHARSQLVKILESGRWANPLLGHSWYRNLLDPLSADFTEKRIRSLLTAKEIQVYKDKGLIPTGIL